MKRIFTYLFFALIAFNVILASWYVLHGDIYFTSDIGRDFLLLKELDQKKIVLIGPRSSGELYHGPLWAYLNYPAFSVGSGNPVTVGWWWVLLSIGMTALCFFIGKKLFNKDVGIAFALMTSLYLTFHTREFGNPHGAMFFIPLWFFCFIRYVQTKKIKFLAAHIVLCGVITQFQLAVGVPFTVLSIGALVWMIMKKRQYAHLAWFALLPLSFINFIIFDLKHDHLLYHKLLSFITPVQGGALFDYTMYIKNRVWLLFSSTELLRRDPGNRNLVLFSVLLIFLFIQLRDRKHRLIYLSFLYFYVGFFVMSFIDKGPILYFHLYPLFPFVFLIFCSFFTSRFKKIFFLLFIIIYGMNLYSSVDDVRRSSGFTGINQYSWKFLSTMTKKVFEGPESTFGYFVYSPDILGYGPKYAMQYTSSLYKKTAVPFQKKSVTYLVAAPHPPGNPYMEDAWWRINQVKITATAQSVVQFTNGYKIQRYELSDAEQKIYFDPAIDPGLIFR